MKRQLAPVGDGAFIALPRVPTVPHSGVAAKGAAGKPGRQAVQDAVATQ
ncbi:hypothetical protein [Paraburkholderia sp. SIMBA_030]